MIVSCFTSTEKLKALENTVEDTPQQTIPSPPSPSTQTFPPPLPEKNHYKPKKSSDDSMIILRKWANELREQPPSPPEPSLLQKAKDCWQELTGHPVDASSIPHEVKQIPPEQENDANLTTKLTNWWKTQFNS